MFIQVNTLDFITLKVSECISAQIIPLPAAVAVLYES